MKTNTITEHSREVGKEGVMNMDAIHRSFLRAVVTLCVAAMPVIRANAAMLTANNSSANMPVLSENFPIPMLFSDAINGTTLFTLISGPAQGTLAYYNPTSGIVSVTAGVPICPYQYDRNWYYTSTNPIPGSDSFIWLCSDGPFTSTLATVSITVTANTAPVATPSTNSVAVNSRREFVSLAGSHPDSYQPEMFRVVSLPSNGTLEAYMPGGYTAAITAGVWMAPASFSLHYTSGATTGTDSFAWQWTDGIATSGASTVTLNIVSNSAPVAIGSAYTVALGTTRYQFYLSYTHADYSQPRYYSLATAPTNGILEYRTGTSYVPVVTGEWGTNGGNYSWYYTPSGTSTGFDGFAWQISDGMATSSAALLAIAITTNQVPVGNAQSLTVLRNSGRKSVSLSYSHADAYQPMTFLMSALPSGGTVEYYDSSLTNYVPVPVATPVTASTWYYTPNSNYTGSDSIPWRVSDGISTSATTAVSIGVVSNSAPVARDMRLYCTPNGELVFAASYTHTDANQSCTATIVSNAGHGVATAVGTTLVYVAQSGFKGNDLFTYKVSDGQADSATATIVIQVRAPGEPAGGLVDIVVNDLLYTVLSNEVQRLKADLTNEGYTAIITPISSGSSAGEVWTNLNSIYQTNKWLVGALFVGNIAKIQYSGIYSDGYYWNMQTFQTSASKVGSHDIWVGRFTIDASGDSNLYGTEVDLIRYALDANHY
ncbi:MAG: tandem-95 repeat protein, partial [bacterium]